MPVDVSIEGRLYPDFATVAAAAMGLAVLLLVLVVLVWSILRAAEHQPQAMLIIVLGVLATICILGYILNADNLELITIAAAAVGALAGALTTLSRVDVPKNGGHTPPTKPEADDPLGPTEEDENGHRSD